MSINRECLAQNRLNVDKLHCESVLKKFLFVSIVCFGKCVCVVCSDDDEFNY